LSYRRVDPSE